MTPTLGSHVHEHTTITTATTATNKLVLRLIFHNISTRPAPNYSSMKQSPMHNAVKQATTVTVGDFSERTTIHRNRLSNIQAKKNKQK